MTASAKAISSAAFGTLLLIALMMGANHVAARIAFNHGVDVATAVVFRSLVTAAIVIAILMLQRVPVRLSPRHKRMLPAIGLLIGVQSLCLYSSVARLPVALALLAFNTYPLWTALWAVLLYRQRPERPLLIAMPVILLGLALALDVFGAASGLGAQGQWARIGAGVAFALAAAATFGLALVMQQILNQIYGPEVQSINAGFDSLSIFGGMVTVAQVKLITLCITAALAASIVCFVKMSRMGQAIRATAQDARAARVMGINTDRVYAFTFALNSAICGAAGVLIAMIWVIQPFYGIPYSIRAFVIVTAAGLGNLPGVILAALGLGAAEQYAGFTLGAQLQQLTKQVDNLQGQVAQKQADLDAALAAVSREKTQRDDNLTALTARVSEVEVLAAESREAACTAGM